MNSKFESLNDLLFVKISNEKLGEIIGGQYDEGQCPSDVSRNTYVYQSGDHVKGTDTGYFNNVQWESKVYDGWN